MSDQRWKEWEDLLRKKRLTTRGESPKGRRLLCGPYIPQLEKPVVEGVKRRISGPRVVRRTITKVKPLMRGRNAKESRMLAKVKKEKVRDTKLVEVLRWMGTNDSETAKPIDPVFVKLQLAEKMIKWMEKHGVAVSGLWARLLVEGKDELLSHDQRNVISKVAKKVGWLGSSFERFKK